MQEDKYNKSEEKAARRTGGAQYPPHDFDCSYSDRQNRQTKSDITEVDCRLIPKIMKIIARPCGVEAPPQIFSIRISLLPERLKTHSSNRITFYHLFSYIPKRGSVRQAGTLSGELQGCLEEFVAKHNKEAGQYRNDKTAPT